MKGRVLSIAGSDSGGGAGIQADIKAVTVLGGFAMTAITALTAQNTLGVMDVMDVPPEFLRTQIRCVLDDLGADTFKTGMLSNAGIIRVVAEEIRRYRDVPFVLDPVMVAKGGASLLAKEAVAALTEELLPLCTVLTPNIPEAEALLDRTITTPDDMVRAAKKLREQGAPAVLLKGGHLSGDLLTDVLATEQGVETFSSERIETRHTHGTGCTLASAIATRLAQGWPLSDAVINARAYLRMTIEQAPGYGAGAGPLNHCVTVSPAWSTGATPSAS
ncbi:phosphomethylpyrimidine kinase [Acetobacter estunensis NRIC 0472]|uniref:hydroxymethylpyrimidine kinase n=1 Tax=Acetobacter estunensis TaxID=104097 RepID=A0A967ED30_9PROT|nr:bifunctional hydroxymethylpyrimidine kinase/phosphomethylpyrimidine kinase [Acetobacter estunensis]NHO53886.1 bifunctional hydroxymethylpyrimidine kinase/phosphomethylpyrimidine kinase [Acetobacter estunensis]GBQ24433.1 phosphomethylpyrimidine kinase [Acetobacter estunensis NRIC 0472]